MAVNKSISFVSFKPGGEEIAVCIGKRVQIYSTDGKLLRQLKGHKGVVSTLSYNNDGCRLVGNQDITTWTYSTYS